MDARLTDYLGNIEVLECGKDIIRSICSVKRLCLGSFSFSVLTLGRLIWIGITFSSSSKSTLLEDVMRNTLVRLEDLAFNELVALACVQKPNKLLNPLTAVNVSTIIVILANVLARFFQAPNIHTSSRASVVLQELCKLIKLVSHIWPALLIRLNGLEELFNRVLLLLLSEALLVLPILILLQLLQVLFSELLHLLLLLLFLYITVNNPPSLPISLS